MRFPFVILAAIVLLGWSLPVGAADQWKEFRSPQTGFADVFPSPPKATTTQQSDKTQYEFQSNPDSSHSYEVAVFEFKPGVSAGSSDADYFTGLINAYAQGSGSTLRSQHLVTILEHTGAEAILDDNAADLHHLLDIVAVGNRLYLIISAGPKGHETSADAKRFRDSFQLITQ
jgi:hypothetical protein